MTEQADWLSGTLEPGERAVWTGQPVPFRYALTRGLYQSLLSLPVILFSLHVWGEARVDERALASALAFLLLTVGVGMFFGPAWHYLFAHHVRYAITDRRALIFRGVPAPTVTAFTAAEMTQVEIRRRVASTASVHFTGDLRRRKLGWSPPPPVGFIAIPEADRVAGLLRDLVAARDRARG